MTLIHFSICCIMLVEAQGPDMPLPEDRPPEFELEFPDYGMQEQAEPIPIGEFNAYGEEVQGHYGGGWGRGGRGGRGGRERICKDMRNSYFCKWIAEHHECNDWRMGRKCRKTCRFCTVQDCEDFGFNCQYANAFTCALAWFSRGCKRSCNICPTATTTHAPWTTEPITECKDISFNCHAADDYRCSIFWFAEGCKRSCGLCQTFPPTTTSTTTPPTTTTTQTTTTSPPTTTALPTTTAPPVTTTPLNTTEETTSARNCTNDRDDCDTFFKWYCDTPSIKVRCRKFCEACDEETPQPTTTLPQTTAPATKYEETTLPESTTTTTTPEPAKTEGLATTAEMETTTETEPKPPVKTTAVTSTVTPKLCVDTDEKNCHTWESIGLCYSPKFKSDMEVLCPLTCQVCS